MQKYFSLNISIMKSIRLIFILLSVIGFSTTVLAEGDAGKGKKLSRKCKACHDLTAKQSKKLGPPLWNVMGREIASREDFKYSDAYKSKSNLTWTEEEMDAMLTSPKTWAKGNRMSFRGFKKPEKRADMIAYLKTLKD